MSRVDDWVPLVNRQQPPPVGFRQGVILTWDPITAENTVDVAGAVLTNLPILNTSEAAMLAPGDVVGIHVVGQGTKTYAILGRMTIPGTPAAASALAIGRSVVADVPAQESRSADTFGDLATAGPSVSVAIRAGGRALLLYGASVGWNAQGAAAAMGAEISVEVSGATSIAAGGGLNQTRAYEQQGDTTYNISNYTLASFRLFDAGELNGGVNTFTLKYRSLTSGTNADFNQRLIAVLPL